MITKVLTVEAFAWAVEKLPEMEVIISKAKKLTRKKRISSDRALRPRKN